MKKMLSLFIVSVALMSAGNRLCRMQPVVMAIAITLRKICLPDRSRFARCRPMRLFAKNSATPMTMPMPFRVMVNAHLKCAVGTCDMGESKLVYYEGDPGGLEIGCGFQGGEWVNAE